MTEAAGVDIKEWISCGKCMNVDGRSNIMTPAL